MISAGEVKMPKTTMHVLWLLVLMLLALEGVSAQHVQPAPSDQKPKPATSTESATTSLFGAVIDEDEDLVRRLLQQNPALVRVSNEHGTALHFAIGHNKILALLLAKNADVNAKNESGETPLHIAAVGDFTGSAELLLAGKADVNAGNLEGNTPLHMAGSKEMAELLVAKGANIEARNNDGRTPLHSAVENGLTGVIEYLLGHNADVKAKDERGNTPLHVQMELDENRGWIKAITELLLANKADVNAKNNEGLTPLMIATELKTKGALELLQGRPKNGNSQDLRVKAAKDGTSKDLPVKVLGSLTNRRQIVNKYVLIKKGLSEAELIKLAKDLHRLEPKTNFWMLDDDAKAEQLLKALEDYAAGRPDVIPRDWLNEHMVSNVQEYLGPGTTRSWGLARGLGSDKIADIR